MQELDNKRYVTVAVDKWTALQIAIQEQKNATNLNVVLTILQPNETVKTQTKSLAFTIGHGRS